MHNTTHFTSFWSSNMSLCKTHTVCTYICMSKPALFYYLLWPDSTSGATVLDLPLPLPLRSRAPSCRSAAPVLAGRDKRQWHLEGAPLLSPRSRGRNRAHDEGSFMFNVCRKKETTVIVLRFNGLNWLSNARQKRLCN